MISFASVGNDLYTGRRSIDFVGRVRAWYAVSIALFVIALVGLLGRGLNLGIEFTGGSDFRVASVRNLDNYESRARAVVGTVGGVDGASVTLVGGDTVRVETERFDDSRALAVSGALAREFGVGIDQVRSSIIGPSWGASVSRKALQALIWFLVLVFLLLAVYFRTWKMSMAAIVALFHDMFITVGVYALAGLEITPASMIGFLTILGYSLYDTVVVFDKVRENTAEAVHTGGRTYSEAANLAVNQTLVRSINTTVVALLPVGAILVVGVLVLGPGTLLDLAVVLFIGIAVGAYSSIFVATPLLAQLREREPAMRQLAQRVGRQRERSSDAGDRRGSGHGPRAASTPERAADPDLGVAESRWSVAGSSETPGTATGATATGAALEDEASGEPRTLTGRPLHPWMETGPRNQPKRTPKSKR
ncbi:MAG TPA: protein translocase subunit SecF [Dermatophilaceae bacterium]|nr:protein translocase subunit SecF [Dermatophilaceae bacterium]